MARLEQQLRHLISHVIIAKVRWSQASGLLFLFPTTAKIGISSYCSLSISCFALLLSLKALVLRGAALLPRHPSGGPASKNFPPSSDLLDSIDPAMDLG